MSYNITRNAGGLVTLTTVGDAKQVHLGSDTFILYRKEGSVCADQVKNLSNEQILIALSTCIDLPDLTSVAHMLVTAVSPASRSRIEP
jgi:hypothetical protein